MLISKEITWLVNVGVRFSEDYYSTYIIYSAGNITFFPSFICSFPSGRWMLQLRLLLQSSESSPESSLLIFLLLRKRQKKTNAVYFFIYHQVRRDKYIDDQWRWGYKHTRMVFTWIVPIHHDQDYLINFLSKWKKHRNRPHWNQAFWSWSSWGFPSSFTPSLNPNVVCCIQYRELSCVLPKPRVQNIAQQDHELILLLILRLQLAFNAYS